MVYVPCRTLLPYEVEGGFGGGIDDGCLNGNYRANKHKTLLLLLLIIMAEREEAQGGSV